MSYAIKVKFWGPKQIIKKYIVGPTCFVNAWTMPFAVKNPHPFYFFFLII
jgi:hypothetical protein